ncbi:MAG: phosphate ABC transporter ATP-binding protein [Nitrospirota bacterium]
MSKLRLKVSNITKSYNSKIVLNNCSFTFEAGKVFSIIGPNGSGKSTFLRICALIESPDRGKVVYDDESKTFDNSIELRRRITLVFPKGGIFNTSVYKNVAYGLKLRGFGKEEIEAIVEETLKEVGIWDKRNQNALSLSTGEAQRLVLARAIAIKPEIMFLDEPTVSLDPRSVAIIEELIKTIGRKYRPTIIMVTHNMFQAQRLADRVFFLLDGMIIEDAPPQEFFENPKDERTWRFINGDMIY